MKKIIYSFVAMVLIGCNQQSRDLNTKIINDKTPKFLRIKINKEKILNELSKDEGHKPSDFQFSKNKFSI